MPIWEPVLVSTSPITVTLLNTTYAVLAGDINTYFIIDTSGGAFNVTLPAPTSGFRIILVDIKGNFDTNPLTLVRNASEKISGLAASKIFRTRWGAWEVFSDGTDWFIR